MYSDLTFLLDDGGWMVCVCVRVLVCNHKEYFGKYGNSHVWKPVIYGLI